MGAIFAASIQPYRIFAEIRYASDRVCQIVKLSVLKRFQRQIEKLIWVIVRAGKVLLTHEYAIHTFNSLWYVFDMQNR